MLSSLAFYPSLGYNLLRNYVNPNGWAWYNRIDEHLIVGAMPFKSMIEELKGEQVGGVICCTEEFETKAAYDAVRLNEWQDFGIRIHHIPMQDFIGSTSHPNVHKAVEFISEVSATGKTCYVHCKAGRTRSATVAVCYLMHKYDYHPNVALNVLAQKRPQVLLRSAHWRTVNDYRRFLDSTRSAPDLTQQQGAGEGLENSTRRN